MTQDTQTSRQNLRQGTLPGLPGDKWLVFQVNGRLIKYFYNQCLFSRNWKCKIARHYYCRPHSSWGQNISLWMCMRKISSFRLCIECKQTIHRGSKVIHDLQTAAASQLLNAANCTLCLHCSRVDRERGWDLGQAEVRHSHHPARHSQSVLHVTRLYPQHS